MPSSWSEAGGSEGVRKPGIPGQELLAATAQRLGGERVAQPYAPRYAAFPHPLAALRRVRVRLTSAQNPSMSDVA